MINYKTDSFFSKVSKYPEIEVQKRTPQDNHFIRRHFKRSQNHYNKKRLFTQIKLETLEKYASLLQPRNQDQGEQANVAISDQPKKSEPILQENQGKDDDSDMFDSSSESLSSFPHKVQLGKRDFIKIKQDSPQKDAKQVMKDMQSLLTKEKGKIQNEFYMECFPDMAELVDFSSAKGRQRKRNNKSYKAQFKKIQEINKKK